MTLLIELGVAESSFVAGLLEYVSLYSTVLGEHVSVPPH